MKFKTLSAICLAATSVFAASSAMAWESEDGAHSTSANVGLFSVVGLVEGQDGGRA